MTTTPSRHRGGGAGAGRSGELQLPWGRAAYESLPLRKRRGELHPPECPAGRAGADTALALGTAEAARRGRGCEAAIGGG